MPCSRRDRAMTEPLLDVHRLTKSFGGVVANSDISLSVTPGEIHALIGPNGAGKTTLISQIAGQLFPSSGSIKFGGRDITTLQPHQRASLGLARSFQITSIFPSFTVFENVALAAQARCGHSFRFWRAARTESEINDLARAALQQVGLEAQAATIAADMSHGEHRQLEIGMALASGPKLLLMDEPTAGMGPTESQQLVSLLRAIRARYTILLVEHDMDVVFSLADRITVLDNGCSIASGLPQEIRANEQVRIAYLGRDAKKAFPFHA
jgi:branched-chain amino acid transport system ATP-binding protein